MRFTKELARAARSLPGMGGLFGVSDRIYSGWRQSDLYLLSVLSRSRELRAHPQFEQLFDIIAGEAGKKGRFLQIGREGFERYRDEVPHTFREGQALLQWIGQLDFFLKDRADLPASSLASVGIAARVVRMMTQTASVTIPPTLWALRHSLSALQRLGVLEYLDEGRLMDVSHYAGEQGLDPRHLFHNLRFLHAMRYLDRRGGYYLRPATKITSVLSGVRPLPPEFLRVNMVGVLTRWFQGASDAGEQRFVRDWMNFREVKGENDGWVAGLRDLDLGYHVQPVVLALHAAKLVGRPKPGEPLNLSRVFSQAQDYLSWTGYAQNDVVTPLGAHAFERGPGPMGIIGSYYRPLNLLESILRGEALEAGETDRVPNIFSSALGNFGDFQKVIHCLEKSGIKFDRFIEHAMGLAIGTSLCVATFGKDGIRFVGVDFSPEAIEQARLRQQRGELPDNMEFIRADIGDPEYLIRELGRRGLTNLRGAVMIVGNGWHEARNKTDRDMVRLMGILSDAGIIQIVIEQSRLTAAQVRSGGWFNFNGVFIYVHDISGQRPHPPWVDEPDLMSWASLFRAGRYRIVKELSEGSRPSVPVPLPKLENPPDSQIFFCVPEGLEGMLRPGFTFI